MPFILPLQPNHTPQWWGHPPCMCSMSIMTTVQKQPQESILQFAPQAGGAASMRIHPERGTCISSDTHKKLIYIENNIPLNDFGNIDCWWGFWCRELCKRVVGATVPWMLLKMFVLGIERAFPPPAYWYV